MKTTTLLLIMGFILTTGKTMAERISKVPKVRLEFLDDFNMPSDPIWGPQTPGQLSGLAFDDKRQVFLSISDDRHNPEDKKARDHSRFYELTLPIQQNRTNKKWKIQISDQFRTVYLNDRSGEKISFERGDGEGIVLLPNGNLVVSTEGQSEIGKKVSGRTLELEGPGIYEFQSDGNFLKEYSVPNYYHPHYESEKQIFGVYKNNGFESLTRHGETLFTATEGPLVQDGGPVTFDKGGFARILVLKPNTDSSMQPVQEFAYPVDPIPLPSSWGKPATTASAGKEKPESGENGVSEMLALDANTLLVLERSFVTKPYFRNHIRLYQVDLRGATNTLGKEKLGANVIPVRKKLVLDFDTLLPKLEKREGVKSGRLENYEGMVLIPLPGGKRGLVLVSDNNNNPPHQRQSLLLFRIK